jgi:hypothetical protein
MLWHAVVHGVERDEGAFRFRYLLDAMIVLGRADLVDWRVIAARLRSDEVSDARRAALWIRTAAWLSGVAVPPAIPAAGGRYDFGRALEWRFQVLRRARGFPRLGERLLVEGSRGELAMPVESPRQGRSVLHRLRRRVVNHVARATYLAWRSARRWPAERSRFSPVA